MLDNGQLPEGAVPTTYVGEPPTQLVIDASGNYYAFRPEFGAKLAEGSLNFAYPPYPWDKPSVVPTPAEVAPLFHPAFEEE